MIAPISALRRYTDIDIADEGSIEEYAQRMIRQGIQVEGWEDLRETAQRIVVGRIVSLVRHPNADALWVTQVDVGAETLQIVTGADNLKVGDLVPVALHGAVLPDGKRIKRGKLRGEESNGMLCSGVELGVNEAFYPGANAEGILVFAEEYELGSDARPIFGLDDVVVDFDILANRPDCQSLLGLARESAVAMGATYRDIETDFAATTTGDIADHIRVSVEDGDLCPRYMGAVVRNVRIAPSPLWLRRALVRCGLRPVNNIVDITNWVMLEMGQPMHAFDLRDVRGGEIIVRRARPGEALTTLDGKARTLSENMLVIADAEGATGLAGVMGGLDSEIKPDTTAVFFECAVFDSAQTRLTTRALGLRTDSSARYEKGVSEHNVRKALCRALHLVQALGAADIVPGTIDIYPRPAERAVVRTTGARIRELVGVAIPTEEMEATLERLWFDVTTDGDVIEAVAPDFRLDVSHGADLAEEVLRIHGYDALASVVPPTSATGRNSAYHRQRAKLSGMLVADGWQEMYSLAFTSPKHFDWLGLAAEDPLRNAATLLNPLGEDYSVMLTTLAPGVLQALALNASRQTGNARLFEMAVRFQPRQLPMTELPDMPRTLALGMHGGLCGFFALKATVERILSAHALTGTYRAEGPVYLHPGRKARVYVGDALVAELGEVHPDVAEAYGIPGTASIAEIDMDALRALEPAPQEMKPLPKHPAVSRDIAVLVDAAQQVGGMMATIEAAGAPLIESVELFDVYQGPPLPPEKKNVAFRLRLRAQDRTLVDEEIVHAMTRIVQALEREAGAVLR